LEKIRHSLENSCKAHVFVIVDELNLNGQDIKKRDTVMAISEGDLIFQADEIVNS
jgi:hypothetical protein